MRNLPLSKVYQLLEPGPVVLLTTAHKGRANVMAMSWHMMVEFTPPLVACIVSNADYSFAALRSTKECVIAIPSRELARKVVGVGNCSGENMDKFKRFGLTAAPAKCITVPLIAECFANLELLCGRPHNRSTTMRLRSLRWKKSRSTRYHSVPTLSRFWRAMNAKSLPNSNKNCSSSPISASSSSASEYSSFNPRNSRTKGSLISKSGVFSMEQCLRLAGWIADRRALKSDDQADGQTSLREAPLLHNAVWHPSP